MVKARPILMSGPMVRACLNGTKTQTRRTIREARDIGAKCTDEVRPFGDGSYYMCAHDGTHMIGEFRCPYGQPGDCLYVKETHYRFGHWEPVPGVRTKAGRMKWRFVPDTPEVEFDESALAVYRKGRHHKDPATPAWHKRPSIFHERTDSRITLRVTDVRVQRLQDISEADAQAEGAARLVMDDEGKFYERDDGTCRMGFYGIWEHINGKRAPWDSNPWVWAVSFETIRANVDSVLEQAA